MKFILAVVLFGLFVAPVHRAVVADTLGIVYVSVESIDHATGVGTIRVMAVRGNGEFAAGETVVIMRDPCQPLNAILVADVYVDYSVTPPSQSEDGAFFDFTVPNLDCRGRYLVGVTVFDSQSTILGSTTFKY